MEHYRENLRHVVRPDNPSDRADSPYIFLQDFEALYLRQCLRGYASYSDVSSSESQIALAYVEYIDMVIRDEERTSANLFAHTELAKNVLKTAIETHPKTLEDLPEGLIGAIETLDP